MGVFDSFFRRICETFFGNSAEEPSRKRRAEEIPGPHDAKVRCVESQSVLGDNKHRVLEQRPIHIDRGGYKILGYSMPQMNSFNQVHISTWNQNGKENCFQFLNTPNAMKNSAVGLKPSHVDMSDEIQVIEHNHRSNVFGRRGKNSTPSKNACSREEVEVVEILPTPSVRKRHDNDVQVLQVMSRDGRGHRGSTSMRKPFKAMDPPSSSTPLAFTSRRPLSQSPEQPEIEELPSSGTANGICARLNSFSTSKMLPDPCVKSGNTLSNEKLAGEFAVYHQMVLGATGMERGCRKPPFRVLSPNVQMSGSKCDASSPSTSHGIQRHHLNTPIAPRLPKELISPIEKKTSSKRINVPVDTSYSMEPSTSASRQQCDESDLQFIGQVRAPHVRHEQYGSEILADILLKYQRFDRTDEVEERKREIQLLEQRNRLAEKAYKAQHMSDLEKNVQMYLKITEELEEKDEKEIPSLPELTPEMQVEIDYALSAPSNATLSSGFNLKITGSDMKTLKPLAWLNDEVINFYMNLLIERGKEANYPSVYSFNTFFFPQLINPNKGYDSLKRWTKKVDVFANDYILVPVHRGMHWCMAIIDTKEKVIRYYDSMDGRFPQCADALLNYLQKESMDKKKQTFDTTGWKKEHAENIPQQNNGSDCGMFACMYAEYVSRGAAITFTQDDMPYFRRKVVYEILKKKLLT